jgi:hypothetical protein
MTTTFQNKAKILADLWMEHRQDDAFTELFDYADLAFPFAYGLLNDLIPRTSTIEKLIDDTFDMLLKQLKVVDVGFLNLSQLLSLANGSNEITNVSKKICPACEEEPITGDYRICHDCTLRNIPPKICVNCQKTSERKGLRAGQLSAYPEQNCEFCGYNYYLPEDIASVLLNNKAQPLSSVAIEWLLFFAWNWNSRNLGGYIPMIDVNEAGRSAFKQGLEVLDTDWTEMYWGGDIGYKTELLPVMSKYSHHPQLWYSEEELFDEDVLVIHCYPRWQSRVDESQLRTLFESITLTEAISERDRYLLDFIDYLLGRVPRPNS